MKRIVVIASATLLAFGGAGVAFAYWTSTGTGDGVAQTGDAVDFVITAPGPPAGTLAPDSAGQTLAFTVTNPGPGTLYLDSVEVTIADADGDAWVPEGDCDIDDYTAIVSTQPAAGTLAAAASRNGVATVTLTSTAVNQDDCKGQEVPLHFVALSEAPVIP